MVFRKLTSKWYHNLILSHFPAGKTDLVHNNSETLSYLLLNEKHKMPNQSFCMNVTSLWRNTPRTANILIIHTFPEIRRDIRNYTAVKMNGNSEFQFSLLNHVNMVGELFLWNTDLSKLWSQINVSSPSNKAESSANKCYGQERDFHGFLKI